MPMPVATPKRRNPFGVTLPSKGGTTPKVRLPPAAYAERLDLLMPPRPDLGTDLSFMDLFCGIGAFHIALSRLGMRCDLACEIEAAPRAVYQKRFGIPDDRFPKDILEYAENPRSDIHPDIFCSGFPCQPWSKAGKHGGMADKRGGPLIEAMRSVIAHHRPACLFLENVDNIANEKDEKGKPIKYDFTVFDTFVKSLVALDYYVLCKIYDSDDFGIPQMRSRVFIVGFDKHRIDGLPTFRFPAPLPDEHPGVIEFGDIVNGTPYRWIEGRQYHSEMPLAWTLRSTFRGGRGGPTPRDKYLADKNNDFYRIIPDNPSSRVQPPYRVEEDGRTVEYRELFHDERLRLQGFPDGFFDDVTVASKKTTESDKPLSLDDMHKMTGNSISVPCLYHVAVPIIEQIRHMSPKTEGAKP